jgi:hypothetical protein
VRSAGATIATIILLGLLAAVGWFARAGLTGPDESMPSGWYVALILGALCAALVGIGLMTLLFYSSRRGYDEPPRFRQDR